MWGLAPVLAYKVSIIMSLLPILWPLIGQAVCREALSLAALEYGVIKVALSMVWYIYSEKYRQDGIASLPSLAFAVPVSAFGKMLVMSEGPDMRKFASKSSVSSVLVAGVGFVKYCRNCRHEEKFSHHHITQDITNCLKIGKISIYYI